MIFCFRYTLFTYRLAKNYKNVKLTLEYATEILTILLNKIWSDSGFEQGSFGQFNNFLFLVTEAIFDGVWTNQIYLTMATNQGQLVPISVQIGWLVPQIYMSYFRNRQKVKVEGKQLDVQDIKTDNMLKNSKPNFYC